MTVASSDRTVGSLRLDEVDCILFDFFGTLVTYDASRTARRYPRTHAEVVALGGTLGHDEFVATWDQVFARFERESDRDDHEFSMFDVARSFCDSALPRRVTDGAGPTADRLGRLIQTYLDEWNAGVVDIPGVPAMLDALGRRYRLAVVTNTHDAQLVPDHLRRIGIDGAFEAVVTSVEIGRRKPHPAIYAHTCARLRVASRQCLFVGDTMAADVIGPRAVGMQALLVDPGGRHTPEHLDHAGHRVTNVLDVAAILGAAKLV